MCLGNGAVVVLAELNLFSKPRTCVFFSSPISNRSGRVQWRSRTRGRDPPAAAPVRRRSRRDANPVEIASVEEIHQQQRAWRRSTSIASVEEIHQRQRVCGGDRGETRIRWRSNSSVASVEEIQQHRERGGDPPAAARLRRRSRRNANPVEIEQQRREPAQWEFQRRPGRRRG